MTRAKCGPEGGPKATGRVSTWEQEARARTHAEARPCEVPSREASGDSGLADTLTSTSAPRNSRDEFLFEPQDLCCSAVALWPGVVSLCSLPGLRTAVSSSAPCKDACTRTERLRAHLGNVGGPHREAATEFTCKDPFPDPAHSHRLRESGHRHTPPRRHRVPDALLFALGCLWRAFLRDH